MPPGSRGGGRGRATSSQKATTGAPSESSVPLSETPSEANNDSSLGIAPSTTTRGTSRFKPKNVRRDETERRKLEEDRNRDLASKIKAEEREMRAEERRARRGRGRAGLTRGLVRRTVTANGPFSAIASENVRTDAVRGGWASSSGNRGSNTRNAFSHDSENRIRYLPRREHEARVNIDLLNGLTDGHAPDGTPLYQPIRYTQKSVGNLPVGMHRTLHQDAEIKVKTQAELEAEDRQSSDDDGDLFVNAPAGDPRGVGMDNDDKVWHAAPKSQARVKAEPGSEEDDVDVDMADIPEAPKAPLSPEAKKKVITENNDASTESTEKTRRKEKQIYEDPEDEYVAREIESLLQTLSLTAPAEGEEDLGKDDQLFIFQMPPILPPLVRIADGATGHQETVGPVSTQDEPAVKLEDGAATTRNGALGLPAEGGFIGKLNVHKSGKVELDWGGTPLIVRMWLDSDFLTTATIIEQKENVETTEELAGSAYGMGQVLGHFILAPPGPVEKEWNPDISEIMRAAHGEDAA